MKTLDYKIKIGDKVMLRNKEMYKYVTPYKGWYEIIRIWENDTVAFKWEQRKIDTSFVW